MIDLQSAQQAVNSVGNSGAITYAAFAATLSTIVLIVRSFIQARKGAHDAEAKAQGTGSVNVQVGGQDAEAKGCPHHVNIEGRLSSVETMAGTLAGTIDAMRKENREDHGKIFDEIKGLAIAQAGEHKQ